MWKILGIQGSIREGIAYLHDDESAGINLQHNGGQNMGVKIENRTLVPNSSIFRVAALNVA